MLAWPRHPLLLDLRDHLHLLHLSQRILNVLLARPFLQQKRLDSSAQDPEHLQVRVDVQLWL
jgi:hypothetical protein